MWKCVPWFFCNIKIEWNFLRRSQRNSDLVIGWNHRYIIVYNKLYPYKLTALPLNSFIIWIFVEMCGINFTTDFKFQTIVGRSYRITGAMSSHPDRWYRILYDQKVHDSFDKWFCIISISSCLLQNRFEMVRLFSSPFDFLIECFFLHKSISCQKIISKFSLRILVPAAATTYGLYVSAIAVGQLKNKLTQYRLKNVLSSIDMADTAIRRNISFLRESKLLSDATIPKG